MFCFFVYMCTTCIPCAYRGQKRALESLNLELQTAMSCHAGTRNPTWILCENSQCS